MDTVTREQAEAVLAVVEKRYAAYLQDIVDEDTGKVIVPAPAADDRPKLFEGETPDSWLVSWESGPYEWAYRFTAGGVDEELAYLAGEFGVTVKPEKPAVVDVPGVEIEPYYSHSLVVYPS